MKDKLLCVGLMCEQGDELGYTTYSLQRNNLLENTLCLLTYSNINNIVKPEIPYVTEIYKKDFGFDRGRNILLERGRKQGYSWMLMLDSDEELADNSYELLRNMCIKYEKEGDRRLAYSIPILNEKGEESTIHHVTRLIPLDEGYYYEGRVHEQLCYRGEFFNRIAENAITVMSDPIIRHWGYSDREVKRKNKIKRNKDLLLKQLSDAMVGEGLVKKDFIYYNLMVTTFGSDLNESYNWWNLFEGEIDSFNSEKMFIQQGIILGLNILYLQEKYTEFFEVYHKYSGEKFRCIKYLPEPCYLKALIRFKCDEMEKALQDISEYWIRKQNLRGSNFPKDVNLNNKVRILEKKIKGS